jgi:hypothetical protein
VAGNKIAHILRNLALKVKYFFPNIVIPGFLSKPVGNNSHHDLPEGRWPCEYLPKPEGNGFQQETLDGATER